MSFHKIIKDMRTETLNLCIEKHQIGAIAIFMLASFVCVYAVKTEHMLIAISVISYGLCCDLVIRRYWLKKELRRRNVTSQTNELPQ